MRIALISYEMPPESGGGGIGTYISQISRLLVENGHDVTIFCGSIDGAEDSIINGVKVHRIREPERVRFCETVLPYFSAIHERHPFDVIEGPDYFADAVHIKRKYPRLPTVVKLHTPSFLLGHDPDDNLNFYQRTKIILGAIRRFSIPAIPRSAPIMALEKEAIRSADMIAAPSARIAELLLARLNLNARKLCIFPIPYNPTPSLITTSLETCTNRISFVGRLEINKGIFDLIEAIPKVLSAFPLAKFRLIGRHTRVPYSTISMTEYIQEKLGCHYSAIELSGQLPNDKVIAALSDTDILTLPSHHDNFPLACLEAMAAGRGIVGSISGGMVDMLSHGECGLLVQPRNPEQLAAAIIDFLENPEKRMHMGGLARQRVLQHYSASAVLPQHLACYEQAIELA